MCWNAQGNTTAVSVLSHGCFLLRETWRSTTFEGDKGPSINTSDMSVLEAGKELPASDRHSPFVAAAKSEDATRIAVALEALEPIHREVLLLRFQEELSLDEIAQVTGTPVSTISSRIQRGVSMLRSTLKGDDDAI